MEKFRGLGNPKNPSISVNKATGDRIAAAARKRGGTMADIVRLACRDIIEPARR